MKKLIWAALLLVMPLTVVAATPKYIDDVKVEIEKTPIEKWIDSLETYELDERYPRDYCRIDTNGHWSCGCLQFQKKTFLGFSVDDKKTKLFTSYDEALEHYTECPVQKQLAKRMLEKDLDNVYHWSTSIKRGLGLP